MTDSSRQIGIVKWFDTQKGFGMITALNLDHKGNDIFAHHTEIVVKTQQYKYLIAGEYVTFDVNAIAGSESKFVAANIKGVLDGPVMCETIHAEKLIKNAYNAKRRLEQEGSSRVVVPPPPPQTPSKPEGKTNKSSNVGKRVVKEKTEAPKRRVVKK